MNTSLIITILNEEDSIGLLLQSILEQSKLPNEVIIVDGGSVDLSISILEMYIPKFKDKSVLKIFHRNGNRAIGRNEAIRNANYDIILCTDAGCVLDKKWVEEIITPFSSPAVDVVAGYYKGLSRNVFEKCLIPYVLVMEERVDPESFLPAARSMAFRKSVWEKAGGFDEYLSHNEDYVFSLSLFKIKARIIFRKSAFVYWIPSINIYKAFVMFLRFAYGDAEANIYRTKVMLIYLRYIIVLLLIICYLIFKSNYALIILYLIFIIYLFWSVLKNYKYVKKYQAFFYLPLLQLISDFAVLTGTFFGILKMLFNKNQPRANGL